MFHAVLLRELKNDRRYVTDLQHYKCIFTSPAITTSI